MACRAVADLAHLAASADRAGTGQHLGADGGRVLGARVVVGDDQQRRPGGRGRAHQRPLAAVAVAAAAEHDDQPAGASAARSASSAPATAAGLWL